jgi:hypothetical protein
MGKVGAPEAATKWIEWETFAVSSHIQPSLAGEEFDIIGGAYRRIDRLNDIVGLPPTELSTHTPLVQVQHMLPLLLSPSSTKHTPINHTLPPTLSLDFLCPSPHPKIPFPGRRIHQLLQGSSRLRGIIQRCKFCNLILGSVFHAAASASHPTSSPPSSHSDSVRTFSP